MIQNFSKKPFKTVHFCYSPVIRCHMHFYTEKIRMSQGDTITI